MKQQLKFFDQTQPPTLQIAVMLFYFFPAFDIIAFALFRTFNPILFIFEMIGAVCAFGIANEKRIGYLGAIAIALLRLVAFIGLSLLWGESILSFNGIIALMFDIALIALLVHPQSREYQKIWFR